MQQHAYRIQEDYEELLKHHWFEITKHAEGRLKERGISWKAVFEILECYAPVSWIDVRYQQWMKTAEEKLHLDPYEMVICGESEMYPDNPIAIICSYGEKPPSGKKWEMKIITAFYINKEQWASDLSHRLCFC
jgi:hypothetical protein